MKNANFQILLGKESRDLNIFSDGVTLHSSRRLPFELNCSPTIFSCGIASLSNPLLKEGCVRHHLDVLILMALKFTALLERLEQLLDILAQNVIKLNLSKCSFDLRKITFLGHKISAESSKPDAENVESVSTMKAPTLVKKVRRLLGMCGFYGEHFPSFAKVATSLSKLTKA